MAIKRVIIVDDDKGECITLHSCLNFDGFRIEEPASGLKPVDIAVRAKFDEKFMKSLLGEGTSSQLFKKRRKRIFSFVRFLSVFGTLWVGVGMACCWLLK